MATVYQHSTLAALMAGLLDATLSLEQLLNHGDTGIGTLDGVDGEVIILAGEVYQATSDGKVHHITDLKKGVPFATVHEDRDAVECNLTTATFAAMNELVEQHTLKNGFTSIQLHGVFEHVQVRVAPKAEKPYPSLLALAKEQPTFEADQVTGTLLGYYTPALYDGMAASGWHVHFISDQHDFAGHVLDFSAKDLTGTFTLFENFELHLPIENDSFRKHELDMATLSADIAQAEGN